MIQATARVLLLLLTFSPHFISWQAKATKAPVNSEPSEVAPNADYTIHTLYIFNFLKYVEWPSSSKSIRIGVVDNSSAEEHLLRMAKTKSSSGAEISVINTRNETELGTCQIIFIPANATGQVSKLVERYASQPILIVTEEADLTKKGAGISFKLSSDKKLRFQINEEVIRTKGLKVSGSLTSLAEK